VKRSRAPSPHGTHSAGVRPQGPSTRTFTAGRASPPRAGAADAATVRRQATRAWRSTVKLMAIHGVSTGLPTAAVPVARAPLRFVNT
jgi:hypothetical protein